MLYLREEEKKFTPLSNDDKLKILEEGKKTVKNPWSSEICKVPSRHLVIGASEQGKTFAVLMMLLHDKCPYTFPYGQTLFIIHPTSKDQKCLHNAKQYLDEKAKQFGSGTEPYESIEILVSKNIDSEAGKIKEFVDRCGQREINPMLIIDDAYGTETTKSNFLVDLYCKGRHKNISVMFLTQVALGTKAMCDIRRQGNYLWFFKSYKNDIRHLCEMIFDRKDPGDVQNERKFLESYHTATEIPHGYFVYAPFIDGEHKFRINYFFPPDKQPDGDTSVPIEKHPVKKSKKERAREIITSELRTRLKGTVYTQVEFDDKVNELMLIFGY